MDASGRGREPRPGIQCPDWCGPVHITGVHKEDVTCPCGYGYYSKRTGEFISGDLVRAGKAPPKDSEEITVPEKCWNDPARGGRDGQVHELPGHDPRGYEGSKRQRNCSPGLRPGRHDRQTPPPEIYCWIPSTDIDFEVISSDLPLYLGPTASVARGAHPRDDKSGFLIKAPYTLTVSMISDLKADTLRWRNESGKYRSNDYKLSQTRKFREKNSSYRPQPSTPQGRAETPAPLQSSTHYQLYREESSRPVRQTDAVPRSSHTAPGLPPGPDSRETSYGGHQKNIPSAPQHDSREQSNVSRSQLEAQIARELRDAGQTTITRVQLDNLVEQAMQRLQAPSISKDAVRPMR